MVTNFTEMLLNEVASKLKMNIFRVTRPARELRVSLTFKLAQMVAVVVGGS